jgi:hypothetical protein
MLNNILITYVLDLEKTNDPVSLVELMSFLNETKLLNVRYTQSTEELKLMKIAVYIQQKFKPRIADENTDDIRMEDPM